MKNAKISFLRRIVKDDEKQVLHAKRNLKKSLIITKPETSANTKNQNTIYRSVWWNMKGVLVLKDGKTISADTYCQ